MEGEVEGVGRKKEMEVCIYKINEDREEMKVLITCLSMPSLSPPLLVPVKQELKSPWYIKG